MATLSREVAEVVIDEMLELAFDTAKGHPRRASIEEFMERASTREVETSDDCRRVSVEWEQWTTEERRRHFAEQVCKGGTMIAFGERLRELRSPLVEKWLAEQEQARLRGGGK